MPADADIMGGLAAITLLLVYFFSFLAPLYLAIPAMKKPTELQREFNMIGSFGWCS